MTISNFDPIDFLYRIFSKMHSRVTAKFISIEICHRTSKKDSETKSHIDKAIEFIKEIYCFDDCVLEMIHYEYTGEWPTFPEKFIDLQIYQNKNDIWFYFNRIDVCFRMQDIGTSEMMEFFRIYKFAKIQAKTIELMGE